MDYEDFVLQIEHGRSEGLTVRVLQSPVGGETSCPFNLTPDLEKMLASLDLLRSITAQSRRLSPQRHLQILETASTLLDAQSAGTALFDALFPPPVRSLFDQSCGALRNGQGGLRLKLRFDLRDAELSRYQGLPWELLCRPDTNQFLCLDRRFSVVRYLEVPTSAVPMISPSPLRVLVVMATPSDPQLAPLDLDQERRHLNAALQDLKGVEVQFLTNPDPARLHARLTEGPWHVLHFMGHGSFDKTTGTGLLYLVNSRGEPQAFDGVALARLLRNSLPFLRLVVLNACDSALTTTASGLPPFGGVAAALVENGLAAVIAMQAPIEDRAALAFSSSFYGQLAKGNSVDAATVQGRLGILAAGSPEWATPALFMRIADGKLFAPPLTHIRIERTDTSWKNLDLYIFCDGDIVGSCRVDSPAEIEISPGKHAIHVGFDTKLAFVGPRGVPYSRWSHSMSNKVSGFFLPGAYEFQCSFQPQGFFEKIFSYLPPSRIFLQQTSFTESEDSG